MKVSDKKILENLIEKYGPKNIMNEIENPEWDDNKIFFRFFNFLAW